MEKDGILQTELNVSLVLSKCTAEQKVDTLRWLLSFKFNPVVMMCMTIMVVCPEEFLELLKKRAPATA